MSNSCVVTSFSPSSWFMSWPALHPLSSPWPTCSGFCILTWSGSFSKTFNSSYNRLGIFIVLEHFHSNCNWHVLPFCMLLFDQMHCSFANAFSWCHILHFLLLLFCSLWASTPLAQANTCLLVISFVFLLWSGLLWIQSSYCHHLCCLWPILLVFCLFNYTYIP